MPNSGTGHEPSSGPDPLHNKAPAPKSAGGGKFKPQDFGFNAQTNSCICPARKTLYSNGSHRTTKGRTHHKFTAAKRDCVPCKLRDQCLRTPEKTLVRQVAFFPGTLIVIWVFAQPR